ncbi:hypothetical protein AcW1_004085 [Taiwanofungus camphoratus]|nr:hypothetical protein AcW2_006911 [Antrodia cinnamomea]KAI0938892.1 hypothetical protein AcV5_000464 [Antrodia cinnamomea]KAI0951810.1 hypothetical protein AcV7_007805 [Antrodia cinnamomea]KAI0959180.1 hypothetical protein AcW1_004085 [Antrodia cinnamomea]
MTLTTAFPVHQVGLSSFSTMSNVSSVFPSSSWTCTNPKYSYSILALHLLSPPSMPSVHPGYCHPRLRSPTTTPPPSAFFPVRSFYALDVPTSPLPRISFL